MIAEDQVLLREGLRRLFEDAGHDVVGTVDDGDRLRAAVSEHKPDLAIVDVRMPPSFTDEGIRAAHWIRDEHPDIGVLVLSQHVESTGAVGLVSQGGFGYLLNDRVLDVSEFLEAAARRWTRRSWPRSSAASRTPSLLSPVANAKCSR